MFLAMPKANVPSYDPIMLTVGLSVLSINLVVVGMAIKDRWNQYQKRSGETGNSRGGVPLDGYEATSSHSDDSVFRVFGGRNVPLGAV